MRLSVDLARLAALGVKAATAGGAPRLRASQIDGFQPEGAWAAGEALELQAKGRGHNEAGCSSSSSEMHLPVTHATIRLVLVSPLSVSYTSATVRPRSSS